MFKLGDKVVSKKTGYPGCGEVCGIVYSAVYVASAQKNVSDFNCWNDLYPDWTDKPIVYVLFEEPRRTVTFEEFVKYIPDDRYRDYDLKTVYAFQIPFTRAVAYPIDDLEYLDENDDPVQNIIRSAGFNE
jgi:hypothetical protein